MNNPLGSPMGWLARTPAALGIAAAGVVSLPMAGVSVLKLLIFITALILLALVLLKRHPRVLGGLPGSQVATASMVALGALALSALWTTADADAAASAFVKSSKLLLPLFMLLFLREARHVRMALAVFFAFQAFIVLSTWWISLIGRPAWFGPMPLANLPTKAPAVFTTYLDQSIMNAVTAALAWHLRAAFKPTWARAALTALAGLCLVTAFVLPGRSGHVVALGLIGLGVLWALPQRFKLLAVVAPVLALAALLALSPKALDRAKQGVTEAQKFQTSGAANSSIGERLHYWSVSAALIAERPLSGFGLGSWNREYQRGAVDKNPPAHAKGIRNPHQEFLLWGVQLGVAGMVLLLLWFGALLQDARRFATAASRAAQSAVAGLFLACLFNSAIFDALIGDFLCVVVGLTWAHGWLERQASAPNSDPTGSAA